MCFKAMFNSPLLFYGTSRQLTAVPHGGLGTPYQPPAGGELIRKAKDTSMANCHTLRYIIDDNVDVIRETHVI